MASRLMPRGVEGQAVHVDTHPRGRPRYGGEAVPARTPSTVRGAGGQCLRGLRVRAHAITGPGTGPLPSNRSMSTSNMVTQGGVEVDDQRVTGGDVMSQVCSPGQLPRPAVLIARRA